jgi:hypothetical protein
MSSREKIGMRDLTYSQWHRPASLGRYTTHAKSQYYQDLDGVEYCYKYEKTHPYFIYELGRDVGQKSKSSPVLPSLAQKSGVKSATVLYKMAKSLNPYADHETIIKGVRDALDELEECGGIRDIESFRVQNIGSDKWIEMSPKEYSDLLVKTRFDFMRTM